MPSHPGISMSSTATSGRVVTAISTTSSPRSTSATISMSPSHLSKSAMIRSIIA
ncbi:MAG TPA: hypothetical protein VK140_09095 [Ktedonobacteraceae bacterium]|nr:hypothetical protein [Ktedonobacteraceae bacterium]